MNRANIAAVKAAALRVVGLCDEAEKELAAKESPVYYWGGTKISGALRRASLDLTRSLAEMRKP